MIVIRAVTKLFPDGWATILSCSTVKEEGCTKADDAFVTSLKNKQNLIETALLQILGVEVETCYCNGELCNGEFIEFSAIESVLYSRTDLWLEDKDKHKDLRSKGKGLRLKDKDLESKDKDL